MQAKAYWDDPKVMFAFPAIRNALKASKNSQLVESFDKNKNTFISETLKAISLGASGNRSTNLIPAANLRRAVQSRVKGSKKVATNVLETIHQQFVEESYDPSTYPETFEGIQVLTGKVQYKKSTAKTNLFVPQVFAQDTSDATSVDDGDGMILDDDYGAGSDADVEAYDKAVDQAVRDAENAARNEANNIANDGDASVEDLVRGAALDQLIGEDEAAQKLLDKALEKAKKDMQNAENEGDDDEFMRNSQLCMLLGGSDADCHKEKMRQILLKMCKIKVEAKNLHNFADESVEPINCETEIVGTAE